MDGSAIGRIIEGATHAAHKPYVISEPGFKVLAYPIDKYKDDGSLVLREWEFEEIPHEPPAALPFQLNTLAGFCDHVTANRDGYNLAEVSVIVCDHLTVLLVDKVRNEEGHLPKRAVLVGAQCETLIKSQPAGQTTLAPPPGAFSFGTWVDAESYNIALQTMFEDSGDRAKVLEVVGNISTEGVTTFDDDGVTQGVVARAGVRLGKLVGVPNPVTLAPFRTFRDIEQPASKFVLRVRGEAGDQ